MFGEAIIASAMIDRVVPPRRSDRVEGMSYRIKYPGIVIHIDVTTFDNISDGGGWRHVD